jgi:hypothetical protein
MAVELCCGDLVTMCEDICHGTFLCDIPNFLEMENSPHKFCIDDIHPYVPGYLKKYQTNIF